MRSGCASAWAGACPERSRGDRKEAILFRLLFGTVEQDAEKRVHGVRIGDFPNDDSTSYKRTLDQKCPKFTLLVLFSAAS